MKNKKITLVIIVLVLISINKCIFASFADYTDEDAEKETQNLIQEHKEHFDSSKSDNNFLENLTISGGTLTPNFDRQILEYSLKIENNIKEINIVANPEDKNATVKGDGKIELGDTLECKIEVIAESGTVRTYKIKIIKDGESNQNQLVENPDESTDSEVEFVEKNAGKMQHTELNNKQTKDNNILKVILICFFIILAIVVIVLFNKISKKPKHFK